MLTAAIEFRSYTLEDDNMKSRAVLCLATLFCVTILHVQVPTTHATSSGKLWAVIVCTTPDAQQESDLLYRTLTRYYDFDDIYYLALPTKANIRRAFTQWLTARSTENDIVFIYVMAHGWGMSTRQPYFGSLIYNVTDYPDMTWLDLNGDEGNEMNEAWLLNMSAFFYRGFIEYGWDVNRDGDTDDWVGIDEFMALQDVTGNYTGERYWDDEVAEDLSAIQCGTMVFVWMGCRSPNSTEHCFSGGIIDDLSAPNRIIMTPTNETCPAWRKFDLIPPPPMGTPDVYYPGTVYNTSFWGEQFISALGRNATEADINKDGKVSMKEAYDFAWEHDLARQGFYYWEDGGMDARIIRVSETPWLDDNGNGLPTFREGHDVLDLTDGALANETDFGKPFKDPDIDRNGVINIFDVGWTAKAYEAQRIDGKYWHNQPCFYCPHNPNTDIDDDGSVTILDIARVAKNYDG